MSLSKPPRAPTVAPNGDVGVGPVSANAPGQATEKLAHLLAGRGLAGSQDHRYRPALAPPLYQTHRAFLWSPVCVLHSGAKRPRETGSISAQTGSTAARWPDELRPDVARSS